MAPAGVLAVGAAAAVIWAVLWPLTDVLATHDAGTITGPARAASLQSAHEAVRTQLITLGAGVFAAGALLYTGRNFTLSRQQLELSRKAAQDSAEAQRKTLELAEQGQVTERYGRAVEQLGARAMDVRIGGIYALERVARDSAGDHPVVIEVLAAFVREHSREQWPLPATIGDSNPDRTTRPDVQAALTVVGRRDTGIDDGPSTCPGPRCGRRTWTRLTCRGPCSPRLTSAARRCGGRNFPAQT